MITKNDSCQFVCPVCENKVQVGVDLKDYFGATMDCPFCFTTLVNEKGGIITLSSLLEKDLKDHFGVSGAVWHHTTLEEY